MKRKLLTSILGCSMAAVIGLSAVGCGAPGEAQAQSYVSLDINPAIELTLDANNKVISAYGANEDGQVLLYGEVSVVGLNVEAAVEKITDLAVEYGFIDEDNKVVGTSVSSKTDALATDLLSKINAKVTATADKAGITVTTDADGAWSLIRKFNAFKEEHPNAANLTISEFKLAVAASETGEISLEAAVELDDTALIKMINDAHKGVKEYATKAYEKAKADAEAAYDKAVTALTDCVYNLVVTSDDDGVILGANYNKLNLAAVALDSAADAIAFAQDIRLNQTDLTIPATGIALALGVSIDELKNNDGKVTLESIYDYIDLLYKNGDITDTQHESIEKKIETSENNDQTVIDGTVNAVKASISASVELITDGKTIPGVDTTDGLTVEEIRTLADYAKVEAKAYLKRLEAALDADELKSINQLKSAIESQMQTAKATMEDAIAQAKTAAETRLAELKAALETNDAA